MQPISKRIIRHSDRVTEPNGNAGLGARWDPQAKVWYVPDGRDPTPLARWLPQHGESDFEPEPEYPSGRLITSCRVETRLVEMRQFNARVCVYVAGGSRAV